MHRLGFIVWRWWRWIFKVADLFYGADGRQKTFAVLLAFLVCTGGLALLVSSGQMPAWLVWLTRVVVAIAGFYMFIFLLDVAFDVRLPNRRQRWRL